MSAGTEVPKSAGVLCPTVGAMVRGSLFRRLCRVRARAAARALLGAGAVRRRCPRRVAGRAQALVEFALLLPLLLLLVLVAIDAGRLFFTEIALTNAAREGAAYGAGNPTDTSGISAHVQVEANVQTQAGEHPIAVTVTCADPSGATIACATAPGGNGPGNTITVSVREPFSFLTPLINGFFGNSLQLGGSATAAVFGLAAYGGASQPPGCSPPSLAAFIATVSDLTVALDASASLPHSGPCAISGYAWDMGDGLTPFPPVVGRTASYTYAAAGTYVVTLTVTNAAWSTSTTQSVTVGGSASATPSASLSPSASPSPSPSPSPVCTMAPTFTASFTGQGNGAKAHEMTFYGAYTGQPAPAAWSWSFGDGTIGTGQNDANDYAAAGTYTVTLTVTNGSCSAAHALSVSVP